MLHVALSSWYELFQIGKMRLLIACSSAAAVAPRRAGLQPADDREEERPAPLRRLELLDGEPLRRLLERADPAGQDARDACRARRRAGPSRRRRPRGRPGAAARTRGSGLTTGGLPVLPSASLNARPSAGRTPSTSKYAHDTIFPARRRTVAASLNVSVRPVYAATFSNCVCCASSARKSAAENRNTKGGVSV
jgi:hypothetical protein